MGFILGIWDTQGMVDIADMVVVDTVNRVAAVVVTSVRDLLRTAVSNPQHRR